MELLHDFREGPCLQVADDEETLGLVESLLYAIDGLGPGDRLERT
jgi:hypothetical protein